MGLALTACGAGGSDSDEVIVISAVYEHDPGAASCGSRSRNPRGTAAGHTHP